jgi:hypothetical protein
MLVLISRDLGHVELSDAREKITSDITGIDPGTFRIVAQ